MIIPTLKSLYASWNNIHQISSMASYTLGIQWVLKDHSQIGLDSLYLYMREKCVHEDVYTNESITRTCNNRIHTFLYEK